MSNTINVDITRHSNGGFQVIVKETANYSSISKTETACFSKSSELAAYLDDIAENLEIPKSEFKKQGA